MKINDYENDLNDFLASYHYQPQLTEQLDNLQEKNFDQSLLDMIVLWKTNRYVSMTDELFQRINNLKFLKYGQHRDGREVLEYLLNVRGIDLPMASTILRFRNPNVFQMIDRHAFRAIYDEDYPLYSTTPINNKITVYFKYLDTIIEMCERKNLDFLTIDRLLYEFDRKINKCL